MVRISRIAVTSPSAAAHRAAVFGAPGAHRFPFRPVFRCAASAAVLLALLCGPGAAQEARKPTRVVSLNLCADELVLRLADPGQVASVTFLSRDPGSSNVADSARTVPVNRGLAEEVVPLAPDLVITGAFTTRTTTALLKDLGIPVLELGVPETLDEAYAQIRTVAARLGTPARGEAMVAEIAAAFADLPPPRRHRPVAVVLRPNGFTAGPASLANDLMAKAGLDNLAVNLKADRLGQVSVEEILVAQPDILIVDSAPDAPPSLAQDILRHPALDRLAAGRVTVQMPARLWSCPGPDLAEVARRLAQASQAMDQRAPEAATGPARLAP